MKLTTLSRRFALPSFIVTLLCWRKFGAFVSPRAEVEYSPHLTLGHGTKIGSFTKLKCSYGPMTIGHDTTISTGCFLSSNKGGIHIGDDCLISSNVSIVDGNYRYDDLKTPIRLQAHVSKGIRIGNNVWIGSNAVISDGAAIGDGCIVSAGSIVSSTVPENSIVQGNPAKVIFTRR